MSRFISGVVLGCLMTAGAARADFIAMNRPAPNTGTQDGGPGLGEDFTVGAAGIKVTRLGAFDSAQDGLKNSIGGVRVQVYNNATQQVVVGLDATVTTANSAFLSAGDAYRFITAFTPVTLTSGSYRIVAYGYDANERNGNVGTGSQAAVGDTGGGLISFPASNGSGGNNFAGPGTPGTYPTGADGSELNRYLAGSFTFTSVPEPGSMAAVALLGVAGAARRRRRRSV